MSSNSFVSSAAPKRFSFSFFHLHHPIIYHSTVDVAYGRPFVVQASFGFCFCSPILSRCVLFSFHSPSHSQRCRPPERRVGSSRQSVCGAACPAASRKAVDFEVFGQVIAAGKLLLADDALVWLHSGVGATVAGQLVRAGESAGKDRPRQSFVFGFDCSDEDDDNIFTIRCGKVLFKSLTKVTAEMTI